MKLSGIGFSAVEGTRMQPPGGRQGEGGDATRSGKDFLSLVAASNSKLAAKPDEAPADTATRREPFRTGLAGPSANRGSAAGDALQDDAGPSPVFTDAATPQRPGATVGNDVEADAISVKLDVDGAAVGRRDEKADGAPEAPVDTGAGLNGRENAEAQVHRHADLLEQARSAGVSETTDALDRDVPASDDQAPLSADDAVADGETVSPMRARAEERPAPAATPAAALPSVAAAAIDQNSNRSAALEHAATMAAKTGKAEVPAGADSAEPVAVANEGRSVDAGTERARERRGPRSADMPVAAKSQARNAATETPRLPEAASQVARDVAAPGQFAAAAGPHPVAGHGTAATATQSLMTAIEHNSGWTRFLSDPVARLSQHTGPGGVNVDVLKIDLHPASLGRMEASLKARGDQMSITITVTSREAAASIGSDIAGLQAGLRAAGYTVDQVVVETRGQGDASAGWTASQQDGSAGGFTRRDEQRQATAPAGTAIAATRIGGTGDETTSPSGSGYVI